MNQHATPNLPEPRGSVLDNPNYHRLRKLVGPGPERSDDGTTLVWVERKDEPKAEGAEPEKDVDAKTASAEEWPDAQSPDVQSPDAQPPDAQPPDAQSPDAQSDTDETADDSDEDDDDSIGVMMFQPETPLERAEAEEFYEAAHWQVWRTEADLVELFKVPGPWMIRQNIAEIYSLLTADCARRLLTTQPFPADWHEADDCFTNDPQQAARLESHEAMELVPRMMATYPHEDVVRFEPVRPEHAMVDLRFLRLRPGPWGPKVYDGYNVGELLEVFQPPEPVRRSKRHPFVLVPDAWLCLIDVGVGPGTARFASDSQFIWTANCPNTGREDHDATCNCLPRAMREADGTILTHLFARDGKAGRYVYLGLGHMYSPPTGDETHWKLEPDLEPWVYEAIGGYTGWELVTDEPNATPTRIFTPDELKQHLEQLDPSRAAVLRLTRWQRDELRIILAADHAGLQHRTLGTCGGSWQYRTRHDHDGQPCEVVTLDEEAGLDLPASTVLSRNEAVVVAMQYVASDGEILDPERWTEEPYGVEEESAQDPAEESDEVIAVAEGDEADGDDEAELDWIDEVTADGNADVEAR